MRLRILKSLAVIAALLSIAVAAAAQRSGGGAILAIDEPPDAARAARGGGGMATQDESKSDPPRSGSAKRSRPPAKRVAVRKTPTSRPTPRAWDGFVVGDKYTFLNFEVVSAAKPYHTREAKASGASGLVQVEVLIDERGNVVSARARTGNKLLHPEAERAALESKFNKPMVYGKPARAVGFLVYRFGSEEID